MDTVHKWMTHPAITVSETLALTEIHRILREQHIRRLPVVDGTGLLVGIITEGDINRVSQSRTSDVHNYSTQTRELLVRDVMTRAVITVMPDTPIMRVAKMLLEHQISGVPVVDDGRVIGVITESDLFRMLVVARLDIEDDGAKQFDSSTDEPRTTSS